MFLSINDLPSKSPADKRAIAVKLHSQYGHPIDSQKLKTVLQEASISDSELLKQIDSVTEECDICSRYRKARSRPVVSLPLARNFNDCLAMDLKFITIGKQHTILHDRFVFSL